MSQIDYLIIIVSCIALFTTSYGVLRIVIKRLQSQERQKALQNIIEAPEIEKITPDKPSPEHIKYVEDLITECIFADRKPKH